MPSEAQCVGFVICSRPVGGEVVYLELRIYMKTPLCVFDSGWLSHKDTKQPEYQAIHRAPGNLFISRRVVLILGLNAFNVARFLCIQKFQDNVGVFIRVLFK